MLCNKFVGRFGYLVTYLCVLCFVVYFAVSVVGESVVDASIVK